MKYNKLTILHPFLLTVLLLWATACTKGFKEINNPDERISEEELNRDNFKLGAFYPNMIFEVVPQQENRFQHEENMVGQFYARYLHFTKDAWVPDRNFPKYTVPDSWIDAPFKQMMTATYENLNEIKKITDGKGVGYAWAQLLRVAMMHRLTDTYGPIPFSKVDKDLRVAYDSQEEVYKQMLEILDSAVDQLLSYANSHPGQRDFAEFDPVYKGDMLAWARFGNSLRLRMAIRMRFAAPELAQKAGEIALSSPAGLISSNEQNAKIEYSPSPIYKICVEWSDAVITADVDSYLNGYQDPRATAMFLDSKIESSPRTLVGFRTGSTRFSHSQAIKYSTAKAEKRDTYPWLTAAEVAFLRAEAALAGWKAAGNIRENYENGISLSFKQWGVSGAESYLSNNTLTPTGYSDPQGVCADAPAASTVSIQWSEDATEEEKLEKIITQKWIALFPLGHEAWAEYRRTGYPKLLPLASAAKHAIPVANRLPLPPSELLQNTANAQAAQGLLGGPDNFATKLWWQRKDIRN